MPILNQCEAMRRFSELERKYVLEAINDEFRTSRNNVFCSRLEKAVAEMYGVGYALALVNGTVTLHTAIAAAAVEPNDEVIVPPLTMSSTAISVLHNGSIPVFADVDRETFDLDAAAVERCVSARTRAVMSVSLYGLPPDYDSILAVCRKFNLVLIEDNAESFLSSYKGRLAGCFGQFASISFQASKHLTCGEGGMLLVQDEALAQRARRFSSLGYAGVDAKKGKISRDDIQDPCYSRHVSLGFNFRMSELCAAAALGQVERASELVAQRQEAARLFSEAIAGFDFLVPQVVPVQTVHSYWTYGMVLDTDNPDKDWYEFRRLFMRNGGDGYYAAWKLSYREPLFLDYVQNLKAVRQSYELGLCPVAEWLQPRMIQLKTNYWDTSEAKVQAEILNKTASQFSN